MFYQERQEHQQILEMNSMIESIKVSVFEAVKTRKKCSDMNGNKEFQSDLGVLTVSGSVKADALNYEGRVLKTGCEFVFRFLDEGVSKDLTGKEISLELYNNSEIM